MLGRVKVLRMKNAKVKEGLKGLFIRAKKGINDSNNWGERGGREANKSLFTATCAALVYEPSENDNGWMNSQVQHAFWGHINGFLNRQYPPLNFSGSHYPLDSLIRPKEPGTNQGGLLYGPAISKSIQASGFNPIIWLIPYLSPSPKPPLNL